MDAQKWIGFSMTAWGTVISIVSVAGPVLAPLLGGEVNPTDVSELGTAGTGWLNATGVLVGSIMNIWGRFRAKSKVTALPSVG